MIKSIKKSHVYTLGSTTYIRVTIQIGMSYVYPFFFVMYHLRIPSFRYDSKIIATFVTRQGKSSRWDHFGTIFWTFSPIVASVHLLLLSIIQTRMRKSILRSSSQISMIHHHRSILRTSRNIGEKVSSFVFLPFPLFVFSFTFSFLPFRFSSYSLRLVYILNEHEHFQFGSWEKFDGPRST